MHKLYLLVFLLPAFLFSQKLVFSYDESGNQIKRDKVSISSRVAQNESSILDIEKTEIGVAGAFV